MDTSMEHLAHYPFKLVTPNSHSSPLSLPTSIPQTVLHSPQISASPSLPSSVVTTGGKPHFPMHLNLSQGDVPLNMGTSSRFLEIMHSFFKGGELSQDQINVPISLPNRHQSLYYPTSDTALTSPLISPPMNSHHTLASPSLASSRIQESEVQRMLQEAVTLSRMTIHKLSQPVMSSISPLPPDRRTSTEEGNNTRTCSLEISADTQMALESSGSTPPSTENQIPLQMKEEGEEEEEEVDAVEENFLKTSDTWCKKETELSNGWPSLHSNLDTNLSTDLRFSTSPSDEYEDRFGLSQLELFTDSIQPDTDGIYFCHRCDYTGKKRHEFQFHLRCHYEFQCPKCDYTSHTEGRLKRHMEGFHSEVPPENFSGKCTKLSKPKFQRCKQCNYVAETKTEYWSHQRLHIKEERRLECTQCPFVTEYRHHLEYHIRNHLGSKPYKCSKCNYECVNKSMLNSHMKSHTNVYQYRCANCNYAAKYCHSLKMHLNKHNHSRAVILNVDGSLPTESGDNLGDLQTQTKTPPHQGNTTISSFPSSINEMLKFGDTACNIPPFNPFLPDPKQMLPQVFPSYLPTQPFFRPTQSLPPLPQTPSGLAAMAAFMLSMHQRSFLSAEHLFPTSVFALNTPIDNETVLDLSSHKLKKEDGNDELPECKKGQQVQSTRSECKFCEIIFKNQDLFDIHMRFHNPKDPFLCNRCGQQSLNQIDFFRHLSEKEHLNN